MKRTLLLISLVLISVFTYAQVNVPTSVKAQQVDLENKALIEWTAPTGGAVAGYKVYYNIKGATTTDSVRVTTTNHTLTGLTADTVYVIKVRAFKVTTSPADTTYSNYTIPMNVVISKPLVAPEIAIEPSFTTPDRITMRLIDANLYETGFEIKLESDGPDIILTAGKATPEIVVNAQSLKPKTKYKITARAIRKVSETVTHNGPWSEAKYETTKTALPPAAVNFKKEADCPYGVAFTWDYSERSEDITYVVVQSSFDGWNFTNIGSVPANEKFFYYSGAEPGVNYFYRINTQNSTGETYSAPFQIFTQAYKAPNPPQNLRSIEKYTDFLTVAWDPGIEDNVCKTNIIANTEIAVRINGEPMKVVANVPIWIKSYKIEGLKPNDAVEIFFRNYSDKGLYNDQWVSFRDTTYGPPSKPLHFIGVLNKNNFGEQVLYLSWDDTADEAQYYIERSTDKVNFTLLAFLKQDQTRLPDTWLQEGVDYYYRVKAENWAGSSPYSDIIGPFNIDYTSAPNAPYGLVAKKNGNGVDLTWIDDTIKEKGYIIEKSVDNENAYVQIGELGRNAVSFRDANISAGKTYFYRVKAWNDTFGSSQYSKSAKIEIPAATSGFVFDATVYPNPVSETLNIKAEGINSNSAYHLRVFDPNNQLVIDKEIRFGQENTASVAIRSLAPGAYNLVLSSGKEKVSRKIVKL